MLAARDEALALLDKDPLVPLLVELGFANDPAIGGDIKNPLGVVPTAAHRLLDLAVRLVRQALVRRHEHLVHYTAFECLTARIWPRCGASNTKRVILRGRPGLAPSLLTGDSFAPFAALFFAFFSAQYAFQFGVLGAGLDLTGT